MRKKRPGPWQWHEEIHGYRLTADVVEDEATGDPVVVGLRFDRIDGDSTKPVSFRDVKRLPIETFLARARAAVSVMHEAGRDAPATGEGVQIDPEEIGRRIRRASAPRGRPQRGKSQGYYAQLLVAHRDLKALGVLHPGVELARRKGVEPNTIYQQLYRARKLEQGSQEG